MELIAGVLASVLGTTGVIGVVTASVQLSRRARLKRSIAAGREAAEAVAPESPTRQMLQQAIETDVLRLAAMSLVTFSATLRSTVLAYVGALLSALVFITIYWLAGGRLRFSMWPLEASSSLTDQPFGIQLAVIAALYTVGFGVPAALIVDLQLQLSRERLVSHQMLKNAEVILTAQLLKYRKEQATQESAASDSRRGVRGVAHSNRVRSKQSE